jgi:molybdopterin converting factor small subunit
MKLEVRFFASLADVTGCASDCIDRQSAADVAELWNLLTRRYPALENIGYRPLVACDLEYVSWERSLEGVKVVAFMPPVSGG